MSSALVVCLIVAASAAPYERPSNYGQPQNNYGPPQQSNYGPPQQYGQSNYGQQSSNYGPPQSSYGQQSNYNGGGGYNRTSGYQRNSYGRPSYGAPQSNYGGPQQNYGAVQQPEYQPGSAGPSYPDNGAPLGGSGPQFSPPGDFAAASGSQQDFGGQQATQAFGGQQSPVSSQSFGGEQQFDPDAAGQQFEETAGGQATGGLGQFAADLPQQPTVAQQSRRL